ncbi:MAG: hypothetical protein ABI651_12930 [Verrucomicrobiota bacterium]
MKNLFIVLFLTIGSLANSFGQTNQTEISKQTAVNQKPTQTVTVVPPAAPALTRLRKKATYSGVLVQLTKTDHPLQLINPFAPARYGSGFSNLSIDPVTRRAQGISLLTVGY